MTDPSPPASLPVILLVYDGVAADEAGALIEILGTAGIPVIIASVDAVPVTSVNGGVTPTRAPGDLGPNGALIVPGGLGVRRAAANARLIQAIGLLDERSTWVCATSTGSVLLAAAGVVGSASVATHWLAGDLVADHGIAVSKESFVEHGRVLTAAGSASTAQLAFRLVGALAGVSVEASARNAYRPRPVKDRRFARPAPWWRTFGRRSKIEMAHPDLPWLDFDVDAEVVILDFPDD